MGVINREFLEEYVRESNAIEGIYVRRNHHLFVDHMAAVELVLKSALELNVAAAPGDIHRVLMRRQLPDAGAFRKVRVWVGLSSKPRPEDTEELMRRWEESLQEALRVCPSYSLIQKENLTWHYHHWFEAIHPFVDGNVRTGRLILNNIRLLLGLPWRIVYSADRARYYESITLWEAANRELFS